jgi:hypothetical protein
MKRFSFTVALLAITGLQDALVADTQQRTVTGGWVVGGERESGA